MLQGILRFIKSKTPPQDSHREAALYLPGTYMRKKVGLECAYGDLNPISSSVANDQYLLAQQPFYTYSSTPTHEFYPPKYIAMIPVAVQEASRIVAHNVPVTSPFDVQQLMQQRYDQGRPGYVPLEFHHPIASVPIAGGDDLMVTHHPQNFRHELQQTRS
ncbi:hypothetical protein EYZ11_011929 [Aspergillus tanneri]|uniref:Uncharacterized protein n=1 Tax=Aspergillus tanneri TaxID=1220188 RepID=A0A4S3J1L3_9EURO|nr:hypothetical protein EYZ11_011929 [Aspergillus tanneri]